MLKRENAYFENLEKIGKAYDAEKKASEEKKREIIDTFGYDSEEWEAWKKENSEKKYPIPAGACKAYRAWMQTIEREEDEVEMNDFLWDKEVEDFIEAFRKAGIESFIYTNQSTAVMENLHDFEKAGCRMEGLTKIKRSERRFGEDQETEILGVHFTVC